MIANAQGFCAAKVSFMQPAHGDGGPAIDAWLHAPSDVEVTPDGGYVIADADRLRRVGPDGIISTIYAAGTGVPDFPGSEVHGLVVTPDGDVIFGVDGLRIMRLDTNYAAPVGTPQNPNPDPPPPQPGPPPPGPVAHALTASLGKAAYKMRKGKKLRLKFQASEAGKYRLDVLRRAKRVKRASGPVTAGQNAIAIRLRLKPGRYKLALTVTGVSGGKATDSAKLKLTR